MKKKILFLSFGVMAMVWSCKDDTKISGLPALPSNITVTSSAAAIQGLASDLTATIYYGNGNAVSSVEFDLYDSVGTSVGTKTFNTGLLPYVANNLTWPDAESGLSTLAGGKYKFKVTTTGAASNSVVNSDLIVLGLPPACLVAGQTLILLYAPTPTNGSAVIGCVGAFTGWGGSADVAMHFVKTGLYCGSVVIPTDATNCNNCFKFRLNSDWGQQELNTDCSNISGQPNMSGGNRLYTGGSTIVLTVEKWQGQSGC